MNSHVVFLPLPVLGHITPMLHLAASFVSHGRNSATFVTTKKSHALALQTISGTVSAQKIRFVSIPEDLDETEQTARTGGEAIWDAIFFMHRKQEEFERLLGGIIQESQQPVTFLISDFIFDWSVRVAERFGLPRAAFWTSSATFLLTLYHSQEFVAAGCIPLNAESADQLIPELDGIPKLRAEELPISLHKEHPADPGFRGSTESVRENLKGSAVILINTFEELEKEAIDAVRRMTKKVVALGPLLPAESRSRASSNNESVLKWLNDKRKGSVLYVSFGTVAGLESLRQLEELASGIEASKQAFLWVFRSNLVEGNKGDEFMRKFQERTSERGLVVGWVPQFEVLQHEAVGGFLTHCGWNSVMESMMSGVPMLGLPRMAEQNLNLKFVEEKWGCGFGFGGFGCEGCVIKLMEGKEGRDAKASVEEMRSAGRKAAANSSKLLLGALT